jgi:hypothetical protein
MSGHSTPSLVGGGRAVWAPDTIVEVNDELLGITGTFWVAQVTHMRNPKSTSLIELMRLGDLVFGTDES